MFEKEIQERLREMHNSGMSYDEIAKTTGISKTTVAHCIAGSRSMTNPSISLLLKVFPGCRIDLHGSPVITATNSGVNNGVMGISNGGLPENIESFRDRAIRAILDLDLQPEVSILILKTLKNLK